MQQDPAAKPRFIIPIDGSPLAEAAMPYAAALGGPNAELHLLRVIPRAEAIQGLWGAVVATEAQVQEMTEAEAAQDIDRALSVAAPLHANIVGDVVAGDPADQIIQTGIRLGAEMIVMASHGRGAVGRWTFGSVADRVARGSLIPVTIICPEPDEGIAGVEVRRIVVALDGSDLSHRALPVARDLAVRLSVPVLLVQAINPAASLYPSLAAGAVASEDVFEETFHTEEEQAAGNLRNAEQQLRARGIEVTTSVQVGPTIAAIESVVEPGDVIVITSHGRSGIRRWLLGSVAERLIRCALAPVILVPAAERERVGATEAVHAFAPLPA